MLFLLRFWPVLIPLIIYCLWYLFIGRKITIDGKPAMRFRDGPWYWAVLASLLTGVGIFVIAGFDAAPTKGTFVPARIENGTLIPAHIDE